MTAAVVPADAELDQPKAGFWVRTGAYLIDAIILGVVSTVLGGLVGGNGTTTSSTINFVLGLVYFIYFWSEAGNGQTLGMRALHLKVVKTDGSPLALQNALIRYIGLIVSFVVILIGVIWVAFDANKQGWHDKIASTYVNKVTKPADSA